MSAYSACRICPRQCNIDRSIDVGICGANEALKIGRAALHWWEEPCLVGQRGSGAIFFAHCPLHCVYCQNKRLAQGEGIEVSSQRLIEIMLELQNDQHAANINLVTATHYAPTVAEILRTLRITGRGAGEDRIVGSNLRSTLPSANEDARSHLTIPTVWNTSGYESTETLELLEGLIDIYLVDFKYANVKTAQRLSHAHDYSDVTLAAIKTMLDQVGDPQFDEDGLMRKGVIVRHLVLPGYVDESLGALTSIYGLFGDRVLYSIMNQFTIVDDAFDYASYGLERTVSDEDYERVLDHADRLGIQEYYWQEGGAASESFIPAFDGTGVARS